ncbi:MAG: FtsX-like permease family protein [Steroidobacteraceae bacterium]
MRTLTLALRMLAREWRSGELGVLFLALTVAVSALTGVGFLVDRVNRAVELQASEVLGADLRLQSPRVIDDKYEAEAKRRGLDTSRVTSIISMAFLGDRSQLTNAYAVAEGYPLRGKVKTSAQAFGVGAPVDGIPAPGEVWPDSRLLAALGGIVGDTLTIGAENFRVGRVLISRPDQGSGFSDLAPALVMNEADLPATQLVQPGSRVSYARLFAGARDPVRSFDSWLGRNRNAGERLRDISEASPQINNATTRAGRFLSLASLVSVLLCTISVAMTSRRYVQRHLDVVALLKTLGASRAFVLSVSLWQLLAIALLATLAGSALGFLAQTWLLEALQGLLAADLPPAGVLPIIVGLCTAVLVLAGFALPLLLQLSRVPTIRILRRDIEPPRLTALFAFGPAFIVVVLIVGWVARDLLLTVWFVAGFAALALALSLAGALLVRLTGEFRGRAGVAWRYGLANLSRRRNESVIQIVAFGLGMMALLLLAIIRGDLVTSWRATIPASAPNYFFINIPQNERSEFESFITAEGAQITRMLPMIRGRMTAINGVSVADMKFPEGRGNGFAQREQNLTWAGELDASNTITAGKWWTVQDHGRSLVSVATDFQESLGVKLGDTLTFDVGGEVWEASIASFRRVKWDSLQPNFFLVFPPGLLDSAVGTYMTSANFQPDKADTITQLVRRFPSISIFDMDDLLAQLRSMIDKAVLAVQSVFVFTLFAGLTVLLAAVQATREERRYESAMLRTLGARRSTVLQGLLVEFAAVGLLSGLLAAGAASIAGYVIATQLLEIPYTLDPWIWLIGLMGGGLLVAVAGWIATGSAVSGPPLATLRQG